jgi:hypothetical protein
MTRDGNRTDAPPRPEPAESDHGRRGALRYVEDALRELQYGTVTIVVQDGVVVQVERTERRRFQRAARKD